MTLGAVALGPTANSLPLEGNEELQSTVGVNPVFRIELDAQHAQVLLLSWDTEGGDRAQRNLLRLNSPLVLRVRVAGIWRTSGKIEARRKELRNGGAFYALAVAPGAELHWTVHPSPSRLIMSISGQGHRIRDVEAVEMLFPFDPKATPTTIIPQSWFDDGSGKLPCVISSPDFGQILLANSGSGVRARLTGSRDKHTVDLILELPGVVLGDASTLTFTPVYLAPPKGLTDSTLWRKVRRGWFNTWQPSSRWGDQDRPYSAPVGILSNNVISDPVSFALPFYADQALWIPEVAPGISVMDQVRRSIGWWLEHRMDPTGEVVGYWDYRHFLDANPGILISSWDYVEATADHAWLQKRIEQLELLSTFLEQRDIDDDGMVEATQSGNDDTLIEPARSCCWWGRVELRPQGWL